MLLDLLNFFKNPKEQQAINQSLEQKAKSFLFVLGIAILFSVLASVFLGILNEFGWIAMDSHKMEGFIKSSSILKIILLVVVVIPLLEEIIFRLFLRFKSNYLLQLIINLIPRSKATIQKFWKKYFSLLFYLSAIIFALFHLTNFNEKPSHIVLLPLIVLPQFITGLLIGYMRVRYNFILGFLLHAIHNAIFITFGLLSMDNQPTEKLNMNTTSYSLKIEEEVGRFKGSTVEDHENDSIFFKGKNLKNIISILTQSEYDLIDINNQSLENTKINLAYKNHSKQNINRDSLIMRHLGEIYSFDITKQIRNQEIYELYVKDTLKLMKHLSKDDDQVSIQIDRKSISFSNLPLSQVAKSLSNSFDNRFEYTDEINKNFNISVPKGSFTQLKAALQSDYGVELKEVKKEIEYIVLKF